MARNPTFKLYRICNRENGKAFQSNSDSQNPCYSELGAFFRSPETIRKHLRNLTHERKWIKSAHREHWYYLHIGEEIPGEYLKFYVEVYSVLQQSLHTAEAASYLGKQAPIGQIYIPTDASAK